MSKPPLTFADVLDATIERHYGTAKNFAAACGVDGSSVSRWRRGDGRPSGRLLEQMQPYIKDDRGRPISLTRLLALNYPGDAVEAVSSDIAVMVMHPLARDLNKLLAADSPVPGDKRENLATLVDSVMAPYRTYLRKRKSA